EIWGEDAQTVASEPDFSAADMNLSGPMAMPDPSPTPPPVQQHSLPLPAPLPVAMPDAPSRPRRVWAYVLGGLLLIGGVVRAVLYSRRDRPAPEPAVVKFVVEPTDAIVEVGGHPLESVSPLGSQLTPGVYSVTVKHQFFKPWTTSLQVRAGEHPTIEVAL